MTGNGDNPLGFADDMSEYLQTFLDETEEQLDDLVETMLSLENDSSDQDDLNEAFRLIHSIKGSAGMMGLKSISVLTHHLENRFERIRSGTERLDESTMNVTLRCIDFLRQCSGRLRDGEPAGSPVTLLEELKRLEQESGGVETDPTAASQSQDRDEVQERSQESPDDVSTEIPEEGDATIRMRVRFRTGLQLADLKAQLIVARLSGMVELKSTDPHMDQLSERDSLDHFELRFETDEDLAVLRAAADVDGVDEIEFASSAPPGLEREHVGDAVESSPPVDHSTSAAVAQAAPPAGQESTTSASAKEEATPPVESPAFESEDQTERVPQQGEVPPASAEPLSQPTVPSLETGPPKTTVPRPPVTSEKVATKVAETMRVDIDRLDKLMNLAGELVVNRAQFVQICQQIGSARHKSGILNRIRDFTDGLRMTIETLQHDQQGIGDRGTLIRQLRAGLELMDEQAEIWEHDRRHVDKIGEAIDQLSRVSHGLQQGVLDTRMVPCGPLFNRFKRVVRDLSRQRGKNVHLHIRGEKTELDKRMIDELGDPLVHLVRNSIDHGLESPDVRLARGKPQEGTIHLEASHSGNNVYVQIRDDGGGIDVSKIKSKLVNQGIVSNAAADELTPEQALEYIWHPGFSTAKEVTDVSGRGVGMDVVKTRIGGLNGTIEVDSVPLCGTTFTIRLPLTLAIINCLLVRLRGVVFSMPIDDVREIVGVQPEEVVTVQGNQVIDVRDEYIPLVSIDHVFHWHGIDYGHGAAIDEPATREGKFEAVILHHAGKSIALRVDELLGSQDMVIKSLSDNFVKIGGLSGASILGDGSVCLMLDVARVLELATKSAVPEREETAT